MTKSSELFRRLSHLFSTNSSLRKIRSFLRSFITRSKKILLIVLLLLIAVSAALYSFKPDYCKSFYKKIALNLVCHFSFDNHPVGEINISGNQRVSSDDVISIVRKTQSDFAKETTISKTNSKAEIDYKPLIQNIIDELKSRQPWIHHLTVSRNVPNIFNIEIVEYEPFAIWQIDGKKYIIDKDGNRVPTSDDVVESEEFRDMIILSGADANLNAKSLFNIFTIDSELSKNVYSATWVGNRRWDIRFENGLLIKLPEKNISKAWQRLIEVYKMPGSLVGLKIIDLRVEDKIYLKYDDAINKEIQKL